MPAPWPFTIWTLSGDQTSRCFIIHIYSHECRLLYSTTIVDLSRINELLASAERDQFRVGLVRQSLEAGLDRVHGVARAGHPHGEVRDTRKTGNLEHAVGDTKTESFCTCQQKTPR